MSSRGEPATAGPGLSMNKACHTGRTSRAQPTGVSVDCCHHDALWKGAPSDTTRWDTIYIFISCPAAALQAHIAPAPRTRCSELIREAGSAPRRAGKNDQATPGRRQMWLGIRWYGAIPGSWVKPTSVLSGRHQPQRPRGRRRGLGSLREALKGSGILISDAAKSGWALVS
jgi:hypothetical protein